MVFLDSFSAISLLSVDSIMINSTQHSINASRVSRENTRSEGIISDTIFWTVAVCQYLCILTQDNIAALLTLYVSMGDNRQLPATCTSDLNRVMRHGQTLVSHLVLIHHWVLYSNLQNIPFGRLRSSPPSLSDMIDADTKKYTHDTDPSRL
jgi:hypothetical protein